MTLLRLAGSMLLALGLAALSALAAPATPNHVPTLNQSLAVEAAAPGARFYRALALAEAQAPRRARAAEGRAAEAATIPLAGEFIPEAGQ
jgi:hypothetical protein